MSVGAQQTGRGRRGGFTLLEMVTAMAISSVLFLALGNAIYMSTRAIPSRTDVMQASVPAAQAIDQLAGELESAVYISQMGTTAISFTVGDRDGDGIPERITYAWSGVSGDPLVRAYNGTAWNVVDSVASFALTPSCQYVPESYPGPGTEDLAPTLLQDFTTTSNLGTQSLGSSNATNFAQLFNPTQASLGTDVIGWRPTVVTLPAMLNRTPGTYKVQMCPGNATLVPALPVWEEKLMDASLLPAVMTTQTYGFSSPTRQAVGNQACFTIMWASGQAPGKFQSTGAFGGMAKTGSSPTSWSASANTALTAQLYGYAMRSGPTQTATTRYLLSMGISMTAANANGPVMQTSVLTANHPEIVDGLWEAKFDVDPTTVDVNGDGVVDWAAGAGGMDVGALSGGVWTTSTGTLTTQPASDFAGITVVDVRMQSVVAGATAGFTINAAGNDSGSVPLGCALTLQADGTQTLTVTQATSAVVTTTLMSYGLLPAQPTDLHVVIDPGCMGVAVSINGVQRGTLPITRASISGAAKGMTLSGANETNGAKFSYARVRVLGATP